MAKIRSVELHDFVWEAKDVVRDPEAGLIYEPGGTNRSVRTAIVIETDEGLRGEYVPLWTGPRLAIGQIEQLATFLIGQDPHKREYLFDISKRVHRKTDHIGYGSLDICLWDLAGKEIGQPIWKMLGGYREELPAYPSTMHGDDRPDGLSTVEAYADFAVQVRDLGYKGFKMHTKGGDADLMAKTVIALRDAVGPDLALMIDPSCELRTFAEAVKVGRACDEASFFWFEDPMSEMGTSATANARLKSLISTPLLLTEHVRGLEPKADFALAGATDFLRADPELDMGITGVMKAAHFAEAIGMDMEVHASGPAQRQCMAAIRNANFYEVTLVHPKLGNPFIPPIYTCGYNDDLGAITERGTVEVPSLPGVGVTYDWDYIGAHTERVRRFE